MVKIRLMQPKGEKMKLVDLKISEYLDVLKSDAPAPGGGSVSALAGAQGVALIMMVANLTIGRERYAAHQEICAEVKAKCEELYAELVAAIDNDTEAYNLVSAAYKLPKDTDEDKAARSKAIATATLTATEVPFHTMELCYEGLLLAKELVGRSNPNAASDIGVGAQNLLAGVKGAWLNVKINLPGVKDVTKKTEFSFKGEKFLAESQVIADEIEKALEELL